MSVKADLLAAADLIERDGWCQHVSVLGTGEHCALGAIRAVTGNAVTRRGGKCLERLARHTGKNFVAWNDDPARTAEQVTGMLRKAATR